MRGRAFVFSILSIVLAILAAGCTVGSGDLITEARNVNGFNEIVLMTSGDVVVEVTGTESLEIEADDNVMSLLTSEVVNGRLELGSSGSFSTTRGITYTITAAELVGVTISGSGDIDVSRIDADSFEATISGSGNIDPSGNSTSLEVTISGSGSFGGDDLESATGNVTVSGSGEAVVGAGRPDSPRQCLGRLVLKAGSGAGCRSETSALSILTASACQRGRKREPEGRRLDRLGELHRRIRTQR